MSTLNPLNIGNTLGSFNAPRGRPFAGGRFEALVPLNAGLAMLVSNRHVGVVAVAEERVEWIMAWPEVRQRLLVEGDSRRAAPPRRRTSSCRAAPSARAARKNSRLRLGGRAAAAARRVKIWAAARAPAAARRGAEAESGGWSVLSAGAEETRRWPGVRRARAKRRARRYRVVV